MPEHLLTVQEDEDGFFIRIPADVAEQLDARQGGRLNLARTDGGFLLTSTRRGPTRDVGEILSAFAEIREQYDRTLRRLADS